jgi:UDP:flavonoid glycosyltransferase YjiC (YdhE family)
MPMAYDQLDNGLRLKRLGVGDVVPRKKFKPKAVIRAIEPLLNSLEAARRCRELAAKCDGPAALDAACERLEQLHQRRRAASSESSRPVAAPSASPARA